MKILLFTILASLSVLGDTVKFEQDRASILKMAGEFVVSFRFEETLAIQKDYELKKPYVESAHELVKVVADTGTSITLQHLLVVQKVPKEGEEKKEPRVIKHWSQTWKYEDPDILDYISKRKWETYSLSTENVKGTWTQFVTQVDDSPRYEGYGKWKHHDGRSIWVSNLTNRPLPRREYKKRKDYDIVQCINRNVVTNMGWAHEQHNAKKVKREGEPESFIAHEIGLNTYTRVSDYDFSAAEEYWTKYGKYWDAVRIAWDEIYLEQKQVSITRYVNNDTLSEMTYELVEIAEENREESLIGVKKKILPYISSQK